MTAKARERGLTRDRFQTDLRGAKFYVVDTTTGLCMGGPYDDRLQAQRVADQFNRNQGW
jgi:hypothetical protein